MIALELGEENVDTVITNRVMQCVTSELTNLKILKLSLHRTELSTTKIINISNLRCLEDLSIDSYSENMDGVLIGLSTGCKNLNKLRLGRELEFFLRTSRIFLHRTTFFNMIQYSFFQSAISQVMVSMPS